MNYKIEKGIPIPALRANGIVATMRLMRVGESVVIPREKQGGLTNLAKQAGIVVTSRRINDTDVRVWRVK